MRVLYLIVGMLIAAHAWAGRPCVESPPDPDVLRKALTLARQARDALEQSDGQVALIARVGQDLSKYKLRYSHFGYAVRDAASGDWVVVHELNRCGTAESGIFAEGLGNFFLDDMFAYETLILIPSLETQARLAALLADGTAASMHHGAYNMLAYAFSTRYQNSNQWALEVYALAAARDAGLASRAQAQAWLRATDYRPTTVQIDALTRLGARMFRANIAFDDHPFERRMNGQIDTVTVDSVYEFVSRREAGSRSIHLALP